MIEMIFRFAGDIVFVRVDGINVYFANSSQGNLLAPIDGLKISKEGAIKEFPSLKDDPEWKTKAIERFKVTIKELPNEDTRADYIISDLKKYGYKPMFKQKQGFRRERIDG